MSSWRTSVLSCSSEWPIGSQNELNHPGYPLAAEASSHGKPFTNVGNGLAHAEGHSSCNVVRRGIQIGHANGLPFNELEHGVFVDLRARMWLGTDDRVPHGVFQLSPGQRYSTRGQLPVMSQPSSALMFEILTGHHLEGFPSLFVLTTEDSSAPCI